MTFDRRRFLKTLAGAAAAAMVILEAKPLGISVPISAKDFPFFKGDRYTVYFDRIVTPDMPYWMTSPVLTEEDKVDIESFENEGGSILYPPKIKPYNYDIRQIIAESSILK